jgi:hypothetical protein
MKLWDTWYGDNGRKQKYDVLAIRDSVVAARDVIPYKVVELLLPGRPWRSFADSYNTISPG